MKICGMVCAAQSLSLLCMLIFHLELCMLSRIANSAEWFLGNMIHFWQSAVALQVQTLVYNGGVELVIASKHGSAGPSGWLHLCNHVNTIQHDMRDNQP